MSEEKEVKDVAVVSESEILEEIEKKQKELEALKNSLEKLRESETKVIINEVSKDVSEELQESSENIEIISIPDDDQQSEEEIKENTEENLAEISENSEVTEAVEAHVQETAEQFEDNAEIIKEESVSEENIGTDTEKKPEGVEIIKGNEISAAKEDIFRVEENSSSPISSETEEQEEAVTVLTETAVPEEKKEETVNETPVERVHQPAGAYRIPEEQKSSRKTSNKLSGGTWFKIFLLSLVLSLLSAGIGSYVTIQSMKKDLEATAEMALSQPVAVPHVEQKDEKENNVNISFDGVSFADTIERVEKSVVSITTDEEIVGFFGDITTAQGGGSGVIISEEGLIITNAHVVDGSKAVHVSINGKLYDAEILGTDSKLDIAVIKVECDEKLTPATVGDSDSLRAGDPVVVIGNALGTLDGTVTQGIISSPARSASNGGGNSYTDLIQTDAAINSGNSGGGLFTADGALVGIICSKDTGVTSSGAVIEGLGFAIPINDAIIVAEQLIDHGSVERPVMGVQVGEIDEGNPYGYEPGVYILSVFKDSSAEEAGLEPEDRIISFDGKEVESVNGLLKILNDHKPEDEVEIVVERKGEKLTKTVVLKSDNPSKEEQKPTTTINEPDKEQPEKDSEPAKPEAKPEENPSAGGSYSMPNDEEFQAFFNEFFGKIRDEYQQYNNRNNNKN